MAYWHCIGGNYAQAGRCQGRETATSWLQPDAYFDYRRTFTTNIYIEIIWGRKYEYFVSSTIYESVIVSRRYNWYGRYHLSRTCDMDEVQGKANGESVVLVPDFFQLLLGNLVGDAIPLIFWIAVIVFATVVLKRKRGKAERFLVIGCSLNIVAYLLSIPVLAIITWLIYQDYSIGFVGMISTFTGISVNIFSMAGIICLIYAFWVKFKVKESLIAV